MKQSELLLGLLRIPIDFCMASLSFLLARIIRLEVWPIKGDDLMAAKAALPSSQEYFIMTAIGSALLLVIFALNNLYTLKRISVGRELKHIMIGTLIWLMSVISYYFLIREFPSSRAILLLIFPLIIILTSTGRFIIRAIEKTLLRYGIGKRRIAFLRNNTITHQLIKTLQSNRTYEIIGIIGYDQDSLGSVKNLEEIVKKNRIEELIQTKADDKQHKILTFCRQTHLQYHFVPEVIEMHNKNIELQTISGIPLITLNPTPLDGWGKIVKRCVDITASFFGMIILSPLLATIAILIKLDSQGPILFCTLEDGSPTLRIGQFGNKFHFLKFRTMKPNMHLERYNSLADQNIRKGSPVVKIKNDPRITRIGKFLRQSGLDELPQLWNVLKGEISLVGPRPHLPEEVEKYENHHKFVLAIKPGITGLAQISGRSDLDFEEEVRLDTYYIENWSLLLDLKILIKTLAVPFRKYDE